MGWTWPMSAPTGPAAWRPGPTSKEPVDRIAEWQDELLIVNIPAPEGKLLQKQVTLTGTRPFFVDLTARPRSSRPRRSRSSSSLSRGRRHRRPRRCPGPRRPVPMARVATRLAAKPPAYDAFASDAGGPGQDRGDSGSKAAPRRRRGHGLEPRRQPPDRAAPGVSRRPLPGPQPPDECPPLARCSLHRGRSDPGPGLDERTRRWRSRNRRPGR